MLDPLWQNFLNPHMLFKEIICYPPPPTPEQILSFKRCPHLERGAISKNHHTRHTTLKQRRTNVVAITLVRPCFYFMGLLPLMSLLFVPYKADFKQNIFSSPEPKAPRWAISIPVTPASVVRPSTFSNIFSSETTGPIELKFHMETP